VNPTDLDALRGLLTVLRDMDVQHYESGALKIVLFEKPKPPEKQAKPKRSTS
jgi:hypothetical protein